MKRYRVETLIGISGTWEAVYQTDSLPVARRYAASLRDPGEIPVTRVVDQRTGQTVHYDPPGARPLGQAAR
jgi:hypothetical protein